MVKASKRCLLLSLIACVTIVAIVAVVAVVVSNNKDDENDAIVIPQDSKFITVRAKLGRIQGKVHQVVKDDGESTEVFEFPNIPYASPPVNDLRWRPPVPLNASTILEYTKTQVWCKQSLNGKTVGQEDCLILTVRQPRSANKNNFLPVLFWIHGGGLVQGSSFEYYPGEQCSASLDMVTVSINYRLNVFGFLSIKELWKTSGAGENNYGNYGILDMIVALQWVRDNIRMFGGDPGRVTILGQSGGGAAVFSLITSPLAAGLFHKAIPASGYPVSVENDYQRANMVYGHLFKNDTGCLENSTDAKAIAECLRNLTADQVVNNLPSTKHPLAPRMNPWIFPTNERTDLFPVRVLDPVVLPQPLGMLTKAHVTGLEILIGTCAQEAFSLKEAETWAGLKKYITPKVDGFSPNLYPEFWDDKIVMWDKPYHEKECKVLRDNGFLKRAWGQLG